MANPPGMEVPEALRQIAEKNIEQARTTYAQLLETMRKSQEQLGKSFPFMTEATLELQSRMMRFTEENLEAGFKLATDLARARDMKDYFEIQSRHAQRQMQVYASQAQELGQLMTAAAQSASKR